MRYIYNKMNFRFKKWLLTENCRTGTYYIICELSFRMRRAKGRAKISRRVQQLFERQERCEQTRAAPLVHKSLFLTKTTHVNLLSEHGEGRECSVRNSITISNS